MLSIEGICVVDVFCTSIFQIQSLASSSCNHQNDYHWLTEGAIASAKSLIKFSENELHFFWFYIQKRFRK